MKSRTKSFTVEIKRKRGAPKAQPSIWETVDLAGAAAEVTALRPLSTWMVHPRVAAPGSISPLPAPMIEALDVGDVEPAQTDEVQEAADPFPLGSWRNKPWLSRGKRWKRWRRHKRC